MRKADILRTLPRLPRAVPFQPPDDRPFGMGSNYAADDASALKGYGVHCRVLTPRIQRQLGNVKVWGLLGQGWRDIFEEGEDGKPQRGFDLRKQARLDRLECVNAQEDFFYEFEGRLVTGSGGDPVYVFV